MNAEAWVKTPNGIEGVEFYGPTTLNVAGEQPSGSRWRNAWRGWLRRTQARPIVITNCIFYGATHIPGWRRRVQLAFRCLQGWAPSQDPSLMINHDGDEA